MPVGTGGGRLACTLVLLAFLLHCTFPPTSGPHSPESRRVGEDSFASQQGPLTSIEDVHKIQKINILYRRKHFQTKGLSWVDIYNRSQCQPRWILLNLLSEFPHYSDFLFIPPCVSVLRCAGCCLDEALGCTPLQTNNITMQVIKTKSLQSDLTNLSITQHVSCQCRPKNTVRLKAHSIYISGEKKVKKRRRKGKNGNGTPQADGSPCPPCNKHSTLNPITCECICNITEEKCLLQGRQFHKERCRCERLRR
ncbi:vascular endothelial growth factor B isoform X2 [Xenopus tropicalis]|uniref:Vascular endothelial growth factor B n=1 Tax=Xenopus tropicalis TaxID=8364 RepID=A0A5S6MNS4_XENTR|nr:vascular endothelial growth factor B isoform X2 [Xenopus tropicalis]XP_004913698.1 vascular endothelial growth factor B isoform X2 [Xenopus tropicalis]|eukprot:XP_004913697.1 PREDICTED: vascular endothelial growth factor B isoform X1 [Xenopus tropicalis]